MYSIHVYTLKKPVKRLRVGELKPLKKDIANIINGCFFQIYRASLTSYWNLELPISYFKSVIRTIVIEYNKSFVKKPTFNKKPSFFTEKTQPSGLNGYIPRYIPRPTLNVPTKNAIQ